MKYASLADTLARCPELSKIHLCGYPRRDTFHNTPTRPCVHIRSRTETDRLSQRQGQDNLQFFSLDDYLFFSTVPFPKSVCVRVSVCAWDASIISMDHVSQTILVSLRDADCLGPRDEFVKCDTNRQIFYTYGRILYLEFLPARI